MKQEANRLFGDTKYKNPEQIFNDDEDYQTETTEFKAQGETYSK